MADRTADVTRIFTNGRARGLSDDEIRAFVSEYDERNVQPEDTATPTADNPRQPRIEADERGVMGRVDDYLQYADGIPGVLVGAVKKASKEASALGDLGRAAWNTVAPEDFEVDRPYRDDPAVSAGMDPRNRYQDFGQDAVMAAELYGGVKALTKVPGVVSSVLGINKARAAKNMEEAIQAGEGLGVRLGAETNAAAMRARDVARSRNPELNAFFDRLTNPNVVKYRGDEMNVREAQDFITNFDGMAFGEASNLSNTARRQIGILSRELRNAMTGTLETVGKGGQYSRGVSEYARAKRVSEVWEKAKPWLQKMGYAGMAGAGYKLFNSEPGQ